MATLKGQNIRVLLQDGTKYKVVGKSTNCTVTLTGNSDDASTKDDTGMASKPEITSKSWSVQVESLDVTDTAAVLNAIKNLTPFTLIWDETATADNQTAQAAAYSRKGQAYLNDVTFSWNDRENSTKQLQFTGSGALEKVSTAPTMQIVTVDGAYTKGQFVRLYLGSDNSAVPAKIVAGAKSLSLHVSMTLEDATTKDTAGDWQVQEPTALSYDISSNALVRSGDTITSTVQGQDFASIEDIYEASTPVRFQIANASGANNRTKGAIICSGSVVITQLTLNAPNRQNATYDTQLTGYGIYTVAA
jgi:predicted secreted protein